MSVPEPPQDEHLTLVRGRVERPSARRDELRLERGERREFQPRRQQIEVGITSGGGSGGSTLRGEFGGNRASIGPATQTNGQQSGRISEPLAHELLKTKTQLRLVGARCEIGHTAPLLAQRSQPADQLIEGVGVRVEQKLTPDRPERRSVRGALLGWVRAELGRLFEAIRNGALLQPAPRVRHGRRAGDSSKGAQPDCVTQDALGVSARLQSKSAVQNAGTFGTDAERRALEARRRARGAGAQRITTEQRREFVGGRERVSGLALRGIGERGGRFVGGGERREALRRRHGINRPMPIDEVRAARGRGGEDRV